MKHGSPLFSTLKSKTMGDSKKQNSDSESASKNTLIMKIKIKFSESQLDILVPTSYTQVKNRQSTAPHKLGMLCSS